MNFHFQLVGTSYISSLVWESVAAAAAKSLQSCPTLQPHRWQPTRLPRPWDSPGKHTGVGCHFFFQCMKVKSESEVTQLCPTLSDPMDFRAPPSMGFSRQEYWSGVPLPSPSVYLVLCNFYHICRFGQPPPLSGYRIFTSQASPELPFYSQNH